MASKRRSFVEDEVSPMAQSSFEMIGYDPIRNVPSSFDQFLTPIDGISSFFTPSPHPWCFFPLLPSLPLSPPTPPPLVEPLNSLHYSPLLCHVSLLLPNRTAAMKDHVHYRHSQSVNQKINQNILF